MSFLKNFFGTKPIPPKEEKTPIRALPASWYTSQEMYSLEQRAIFSKKWLLTTHKHRLPTPGTSITYSAAGYDYTLTNTDTTITASHNNHPAHTHIDRNGFIWVNLDKSPNPIPWTADFAGVDEQPRFAHYNFEDYVFDHTWDMEGAFNWKILADNYNECYHCQVAHPDIPTIADLNSYYVKTEAGHIQHYGAQRDDQIAKGFRIATTYFWPNASFNISPNFFFMQRFTPTGPTSCVMRYEVYRHKDASDEAFTLISDMYKRIMSEDKYLCVHAQKNLNAGVFVNGLLHPEMEKGPLHFQKTVREVVMEHFALEQQVGREIWPAEVLEGVEAGEESEIDEMEYGDNGFAQVDVFKDSMGSGFSTVTAIAV